MVERSAWSEGRAQRGKRYGAIGIAYPLYLGDPVVVGFRRRLSGDPDLPPDRHLGNARGRPGAAGDPVEYRADPTLGGASGHLVRLLGRRLGHSVRLDRAVSGA